MHGNGGLQIILAEENEYLWCGGSMRIRIPSIITTENTNDYENYFKSMWYFDANDQI